MSNATMTPRAQVDGEIVERPEQVASGGMARVETRFVTAMAVQRPRSLGAVARRLEEEATLAGDGFFYKWGAGKDEIIGPSTKLAHAAVRCWGNCAIEFEPVQETADAWIFTAVFIDLETGFTLPRQFRQAKGWQVHGKLDAARKEDIRFQIGQSKAIRNVVLNALPSGLIDRAMEAAMSGAGAKLDAAIKKEGGVVKVADMVMVALAKRGVKEEAVLARLEIADRKAIDRDRLLILRADLKAIDEGEERAETLYPPAKATEGLHHKLAGEKTADPQVDAWRKVMDAPSQMPPD